jgi:hypothetical protein
MGWWSSVGSDCPYLGLGQVRLNAYQSMGWWSSVGYDFFGDEAYRDLKTSRNNIRGRIMQGRDIRGVSSLYKKYNLFLFCHRKNLFKTEIHRIFLNNNLLYV